VRTEALRLLAGEPLWEFVERGRRLQYPARSALAASLVRSITTDWRSEMDPLTVWQQQW